MVRRYSLQGDGWPAQVLVLAVGYYLLGRLALLMAIPPGYATAVWPAAGVALAGLLHFGLRPWPGIVLGSFALNFPTALANGSDALPAALVAAAIGAGAAAQAAAGAWLVRRHVDATAAYARAGSICLMLALGGPAASVINPSLSVAVLNAAGQIQPGEASFNWLTWWVGDSIGVLVVLPLFLAWTAAPWQLPRRQKIAASVPVLALLALVTVLFVRTSALEQQRIQSEFRQRSDQVAAALQRRFAEYAEVLHAVAGFQTVAVAEADRDAFAALVTDMLRRHPGLYALSWSPRVTDAEREAFESAMSGTGRPDFRILERGPNGELQPAARRAQYFPVTYIEPRQRNTPALGFDLASGRHRRAALVRARQSGEPTASRWVDLVQTPAGRDGIIIVQPAYRRFGTAAGAQAAPAGELRGYASAVVRVPDMMGLLLASEGFDDLEVSVEDLAAPPAERLLFASNPLLASGTTLPARQSRPPGALSRDTPIQFGDRPWLLHVEPAAAQANQRSWVAWSMLATGMLFTGLFSAFLLVTVGRAAAVRAEVGRRTKELRQSNAALAESRDNHARSEEALRISEARTRSIIETARDAYIALDPHSQVLEWNQEAENLFGWSRTEAIGRSLVDLILPARYRDLHLAGMSRFLATGEASVLNHHIEVPAVHCDGSEIPVELIIWATETDGEHRFHAFLHDISERNRAHQRLAAQEAAAAALVESASLASAAPRVLRAVGHALGWQLGALWLVDDTGQHLRCTELWRQDDERMSAFAAMTLATTFAPGIGLPGRVWSSGKPAWIPDVAEDGNFPRAAHAAENGLHAAFGFPLTSGGEVLGVVEFFSDRIEQPDQGLLRMMDTLGNLLGQFVGRRRAEAALFEEKELAQVTLRSIGDGVVVINTAGRITYLNPVAESMTGWQERDALGRPVEEVLIVVDHESGQAGHNPLLLALRENRVLGLAADSDLVRRDGFRSPIEDSAAPIHDRNGLVIGSVMVFHDVSESRAMAIKMSHLAQHDYLTDLPNRVLLQDRFVQAIERAKRHRLSLALLYMDLDGFKHINDSLGHEVGDSLLQAVAQRLLHSVRGVDTVSRQGGDEFVVLLPEIRSSEDAARVADNILQAMRTPFRVAGAELNVTLSIGISLYPDDGSDPGALLKYADAAMYQAKQHGHNRYRFYTRAISDRADRRLTIESSLHQALRNGDFILHYQPLVSPASGAITGMEALVRWRHEDGELRYPDEFIEIAEESGLISRIDQWVLDTACEQNRAWQEAGLPKLPVSVNLSAAHTDAEHFPEHLAEVLRRTGLDPACLHIEITERQMLHDTERFARLLKGIQATGAKVAIDDFGTGYSSLGYLSRFPFDVLKIDRTFVQTLEHDAKAQAIIAAISQMARALGYTVVAEGVETVHQAWILHSHGCHEMQGYLYSRPVSADRFGELLRAGALHVPLEFERE